MLASKGVVQQKHVLVVVRDHELVDLVKGTAALGLTQEHRMQYTPTLAKTQIQQYSKNLLGEGKTFWPAATASPYRKPATPWRKQTTSGLMYQNPSYNKHEQKRYRQQATRRQLTALVRPAIYGPCDGHNCYKPKTGWSALIEREDWETNSTTRPTWGGGRMGWFLLQFEDSTSGALPRTHRNAPGVQHC